MKKRLVLIKLGGSLITDKKKPFSTRPLAISQIASEISEIIELYPKLKIIIGNGAGSFGHYTAQKYSSKEDPRRVKSSYGFGVVQNSVRRLNTLLVSELLDKKIKAIGINPSSMIVCRDGQPDKVFIAPIKGLLSSDIVPVIYGDIVYDRVSGSTILSTEQLFSILVDELADDFNELTVIYAGAVEGVMDESNRLIKKISAKNYQISDKSFYKTKDYDVTGGMRSKLYSAIQLATKVDGVYIINGQLKGNLTKAVKKQAIGTLITS